jgi:imidazolonepropionase-like amidohydrolase
MRAILLLGIAGVALASVAAAKDKPKDAPASPPDVVRVGKDPWPSQYRPYPGQVTVIRGATIYDGAGRRIDNGMIRLEGGKVAEIGTSVAVPVGATLIEAQGKYVTAGIIDIHSHLGVYPSPGVQAHSDGNEATSPARPEVWAEHSVWPQDPGFSRALAGGITALHALPGSANLFGGRGVTLKPVYGRSVQEMKFPGAPYSLKMACGENPKRVYGSRNQLPATRMGNIAYARQLWSDAVGYKRRWDDYTKRAEAGTAKPTDAPRRELALDTLMGVLNGEILVQNHCYRADEMANVISMSREFGYKVTAFHHAVESYKIADMLKAEGICSAMWADWYGFKMESYDGIRENIALVSAVGACAIVHSDDENGIQRLNQEAAKAIAAGRLEAGKAADVVLWSAEPFSVYARPTHVWIDGALMYDWGDPKRRPTADFELGQPGAGEVK